MKKYLSLLFVALLATLSLGLTSCGNDDDGPNDNEIIGTWQEDDALSEALGTTVYVQFGSDHTFIEVDIYDYDNEVDVERGRWERNGNTIKISGGDLKTTSTEIKKLTSTELTLETLGIPTSYKKVSDSAINKYLN